MSWNRGKFALALVLLAAAGCATSPQEAREELDARGLPFDEDGFGNAVLAADAERVKLYIAAGYDVNAYSETKLAPLMLAARRGDWPTLKAVIKAGARAEALDGILTFPASRADLKTMSALLDAGADIDGLGSTGQSAVIAAIETGQLEAVRFLLDKGAAPDGSIKRVGRFGFNPLIEAIKRGHSGIAQLLIDAGADVDQAGGMPVVTPLIAAARRNQTDTVDRLLVAGADPRARPAGIDAIQAAEKAGHQALAEKLREASAP